MELKCAGKDLTERVLCKLTRKGFKELSKVKLIHIGKRIQLKITLYYHGNIAIGIDSYSYT